jgi:hypothetical protein
MAYLSHPASMQRGVTRESSRNEGRDAVDATMSCAHEVAGRGQTRERSKEARETSGVVADGEVVWSWHPLLVSSRAEAHSAQPGYEMPCNPCGDGGKRNSSPGRSRITRKTIAWGMPDVSGASAVNTRAHTLYPQRARGCGCIGHPAFPAPSVVKGRDDRSKPRADMRREREVVFETTPFEMLNLRTRAPYSRRPDEGQDP